MSISGDLERPIIEALGLELGPSGQRRPQSGKDLGEVEVSKWWKVVWGWKSLRGE